MTSLKLFLESPPDLAASENEGERLLARAIITKSLSDLRSAIRRHHGNRTYGYGALAEVTGWFFDPPAEIEPTMTFSLCCHLLGRDIDRAREFFRNLEAKYIAGAARKGKTIRKLSYSNVYSIKSRIEMGESSVSIARSHGLNSASVRKIRLGVLWQKTPSFGAIPLALQAQDEALERAAVELQKAGKQPDAWRRRDFSWHMMEATRKFKSFNKRLAKGELPLRDAEDAYQLLGRAIQLKREQLKGAA